MEELRVINFLDAFIANALSVLIPLILIARGVDVVGVGFVVSISPVVFVVSRSVFAALSDQRGVKEFFVLNGFMNVVAVAVYMVANTPLMFSVGKMFEGVRNGAIWAVNRTAVIYKKGKERAAEEMSKIQAIRTASAAFGIVVVGLLLQSYSFDVALLFFIVLSFVLLGVSFLTQGRRKSKIKFKRLFEQLDFRSKSEVLKRTSLVLVFQSVATNTLLSLVFPLFLKEMECDYWLIGFVIAVYYLVSAVVAFLLSKKNVISLFVYLWLGAFLFFFGAVVTPFLWGAWAIPFILLMGVGDGMSMPVWEVLVFNSLRSKNDVSSDIALVHTPPNLLNSVGVIVAGLLIKVFGYWVVFVLCGVLFVLFAYFSSKILKGCWEV
ncbi:MAG: MFS transporter [Candidatus Micrarchaeia archaeon]